MRAISHSLPLLPTVLIPAGCLHWPIGEKELIKAWVAKVKATPGAFTMLMGDTQDAQRTHRRVHARKYTADKSSAAMEDRWSRKDVEDLAEVLMPIKGQILGAILGNHYYDYADGTNSEQYLCSLLDIPYLGPMGLVRLDLEDASQVRAQLTLFCHHSGGSRGSRSTSADLGALHKMENVIDADIYCLSHTHRRIANKEVQLSLSKRGAPKLIEQNKVLIRSGAFLKSYPEKEIPSSKLPYVPFYSEEAAFRPTDLGWVELSIDFIARGSHKGPRYTYVDYKITF